MTWNPDTVRAATGRLIDQDGAKPSDQTNQVAFLTVAAIQSRFHGDTRKLDLLHVIHLAQCIAVLGLLEPIVVDQRHRLIAGAHRLAACRLLSLPAGKDPKQEVNSWPLSRERWEHLPDAVHADVQRSRASWASINPQGMIPVHKLALDSERDSQSALQAEIAENEVRRPYTPDEICSMAERLKSAGYRDGTGRPKKGQLTLYPPLSAFTGKSRRTIQRILNGTTMAKPGRRPFSEHQARRKCKTAIALMQAALAGAPDEAPWTELRKPIHDMRRVLNIGGRPT